MPLLHQLPENGQQHFNIGKMQPRSRLVQNQHLGIVFAGAHLVQQYLGQLQALVLPAGQRIQRLSQRQVAQPHAPEHAQLFRNASGTRTLFPAEVFQGGRHGHAQNVGNIPAVAVHAQYLVPVAGTVAQGTLDENV